MTSEAVEVLIAFAHGKDAAILEQLQPGPRITALKPPGLATVRASTEEIAALRRLTGVQAVFLRDVPAQFLEALGPGERLFVLAWQVRGGTKLERPGEGLPWDAPGFEPPDRPKGQDGS